MVPGVADLKPLLQWGVCHNLSILGCGRAAWRLRNTDLFSAFVVPFLFTKNKCFRALLVEFVVIVLACACRLVSPRKVFQQNMQEKQHKAYHWWYQRTGTKGLTFTAPDHVTASLINIPTKDAQYCTTSTQTVVTLPKMVHTGINCDLKKFDDKGT